MSRPASHRTGSWLVGAAFVAGQQALWRRRVGRALADAERRVSEAELTALEHAELHRVAGLVARRASLSGVCTGVANAAVTLLEGQVGLVVRFKDSGSGELVGRHLEQPVRGYPAIGECLRFDSAGAIGQVHATRRASRAAQGAASPFVYQLGERVAAPITLGGSLWGALAVSAAPGHPLLRDAEDRLERFAELVSLAIGNADAQRQLVLAASTDALTGLANHRTFQTRLEEEVEHARRRGLALSLALIDVDHFKQTNDTFGHLAGDRVLAEVAERLRSTARREVVLARIGGDEFAAILPGTNGTDAIQVSQRMHQAVRSEPVDGDLRVTISVGVAELRPRGDAQELRLRADHALYSVKRAGRDAVHAHSAEPRVQSTGR